MIAAALATREIFLSPGDAGSILPAPQGDDRARQVGRMQGALLGGVIGAFGSFFLAALVSMTTFFRRNPNVNWGFPLEMLLFPLIIVAGSLVGVFIGSRLPIKGPLLRKPPSPTYNKKVGCAALVGFMGGFMGGGILGAILVIALDVDFDNPVLPMLLFFGGAGLGAITGPILTGMAANYFLRRKETPRGEDL